MVRQKTIGHEGLILTLFVSSFAVIAYGFPRFSAVLVYDRQAVLNGELWRLATAPLVHFSASHIFWDLLVFGAAGFAIHASGFRRFWMVCGFAALLPGLVFFVASPEIERYGGLSGLATGAVAYFCLCNVFNTRKNRYIWLSILLFMGIKIMIEATTGASLFVQTGGVPFRVLPSVHLIAFLGAFVTCLWPSRS